MVVAFWIYIIIFCVCLYEYGFTYAFCTNKFTKKKKNERKNVKCIDKFFDFYKHKGLTNVHAEIEMHNLTNKKRLHLIQDPIKCFEDCC